MKQLKVQFRDGLDALKFVDLARQSGLYLWDIAALERDILLNYSKNLPRTLRNTKTWYYDHTVAAEFNPWIEYMILSGYDLRIREITKVSSRFPLTVDKNS
jgi:hypothetical protein